MTEAKYARRSLRTLSGELAGLGHAAGPDTVARLLRGLGYRLRVNVKRLSGPYHPDRDAQFTCIEALVAAFREEGLPILSVDTKKKELVGNFANAGATWRREADEVNAHDFLSDALYRVAPYGLYDLLANKGHVVVGTSADTPRFAAEAVARWWSRIGCHRYRGGPGVAAAGRRRRQQRLPAAAVEAVPAGAAGGPLRAGGDGVPLPDGGVEVEPGGASAVRAD